MGSQRVRHDLLTEQQQLQADFVLSALLAKTLVEYSYSPLEPQRPDCCYLLLFSKQRKVSRHCKNQIINTFYRFWDFPGGSGGKESPCNARDLDLIPGLGRSPGEGNGNPLQYSCLENSMDRAPW